MGREHLPVGIDGYAFLFSLFEQGFEVQEVMAGDQNGLAGLHAERNRGGYGCAEGLRIGLVQEGDGLVVDLAAPEYPRDPGLEVPLAVVGEVSQGFHEVAVDLGIAKAEYRCVKGVCRDALQSIQDCVLERAEVEVFIRLRVDAVFFSLLRQELCRGSRDEPDRSVRECDAGALGCECGP